MITLLTGAPGAGKTSKIVAELAGINSRPVFVMGIPELALPHQPCPPVAEWTRLEPAPEDEKVLRPVFTFPANSVIVVDEAQNIYRPRSTGSKVPDHVAAFETHRHQGIDFYLLTQHPSLIDSNIRRLIAKHWHIHVTPFGRKLLEWSQCRDPDSKSERSDALSSPYKPSPKTFALYKSAEVHTKIKRRISMSMVVAIVAAVLALAVGAYAVHRISSKMEKPADTGMPAGVAASVAGVPPGASGANVTNNQAPSFGEYLEQFTPVHPSYPESAPAYDSLRVVKDMPRIAGCVQSGAVCRCYSQQATILNVLPDRCAAIIARRDFDPYREPLQIVAAKPEPDAQRTASAEPAQSGDVQSKGDQQGIGQRLANQGRHAL